MAQNYGLVFTSIVPSSLIAGLLTAPLKERLGWGPSTILVATVSLLGGVLGSRFRAGGLVRSEETRQRVTKEIIEGVERRGFDFKRLIESPIYGAQSGNKEFLAHFERRAPVSAPGPASGSGPPG